MLSNPQYKAGNQINAILARMERSKWILISLSLVVIALAGILFTNLDLKKDSLSVFTIEQILIGVFILLLQCEIGLLSKRFHSVREFINGTFKFIEDHGPVLIYVVFSVVKIIQLLPIIHNLSLYTDTLLYARMAKALSSGEYPILALNHYPPFYSFSMVPVFLLNHRSVYASLVILNVIFSTSAIFPLYYLARSLAGKRISLLFVIACMSYPSFLYYASLFMSENVAYPLFFWALLFCYLNPANSKWQATWDTLTGISIGLLWLTRYMTIATIPVFALIWWMKPEPASSLVKLIPNKLKLGRAVLISAIILALYSTWVIPGLIQGVPWINLFGFNIDGNGNERTNNLKNITFWVFFAAVYFVAMSHAVIPHLTSVLFRVREIKLKEFDVRSNQKTRWCIAGFLLISALMLVVTRHAWMARYNLDGPENYLVRYIIYIPPLIWLTSIPLMERMQLSFVKQILNLILAILLGLSSFFYIIQQEWIYDRFLYSGAFESYMIHYYLYLFPGFLLLYYLVTFIAQSSQNKVVPVYCMLFFITFMNLGAWPAFISYIEERNLNGRAISELLVHVVDNPEYAKFVKNNPRTKIYTYALPERTLDELEIRGIQTEYIEIIETDLWQVFDLGCKPEMGISIPDIGNFVILENRTTCKITSKEIISNFCFGDNNYNLVHVK